MRAKLVVRNPVLIAVLLTLLLFSASATALHHHSVFDHTPHNDCPICVAAHYSPGSLPVPHALTTEASGTVTVIKSFEDEFRLPSVIFTCLKNRAPPR
ncbi:MAG TPA: hypothetical protein VJ161_13070 [Geobacteraceae bacterium]|nr:hypothetical protein [Geobacteraceae bacterium]